MKKLLLSTLALCLLTSVFAAPKRYTLLRNTNIWNTAANWSPAGVPSTGDTASIPQNLQLTLSSDFTFQNMYVDVFGALLLSSNNMKMVFQNNSTVNVHTGGVISGNSAAQQILFSNNIVFKGDQLIVGPQIATNTSNVFSPYVEFTVLPVKFISFSVLHSPTGCEIQWTAAEAQNARSYDVQRSSNGTSWTTITEIPAVGNGTNTYAFSDNAKTAGTLYYRIKQNDADGTLTYSVVRILKSEEATPEIKTVSNKILVVFTPAQKGNAVIEIIDLNGAIMAKQVVACAGTVQLSTAGLRGIYVIHISNTQDLNLAKEVLL